MRYLSYYDSPLGRITLVSDEEALTNLAFYHQRFYEKALEGEFENKETPVIRKAKEWLNIYFSGKEPRFVPPIRLEGTTFQKQVWEILLDIPYGEVSTYGQIAKEIAMRNGLNHMSSQAVGGAVAHNPIALIVPCHRVIGTDGKMTGYAGGIQRKTQLLDLEKRDYKEIKREQLMEKLDSQRFERFHRKVVTI